MSFRIILTSLIFTLFFGYFSVTAQAKTSPTTKPEEVPALIKALKTGKEQVRIDAAYKLELLWPKQDTGGAFAALIKAMKDPSAQVRVHAESALGKLKVEQAIDALIRATHDRNQEVVLFSAQALGDIGSPALSAEPDLLRLLHEKCSGLRKVAAIALAEIGVGVEQAVPEMIDDLSLPDESERYEASKALGFMGQAAQPAIPALKNLLKDQSWNVQQEACRTLRIIGGIEAKQALEDYTQSCGSSSNSTISIEKKVSMLIEDLNLPKEFSRLSAIHSLGRKGQSAQTAVPALKNLLNDSSWRIQQETCNALKLINTVEALDAINAYAGDCVSGFR